MTEELAERVERAARALRSAGAKEVYLFGSAATGHMRQDSDVDLAVSGMPAERFFRSMGEAGEILHCTLDLIDLDEDTPFTRYLRDEGDLIRVG